MSMLPLLRLPLRTFLTSPSEDMPRIKITHEPRTEDMIKEYLLIKEKKSKLSRRERDRIVYRVEYLIKKGDIILPEQP